jgi:hypothetical protein
MIMRFLIAVCLVLSMVNCSVPPGGSFNGYTTGLERYDIPSNELERVKDRARDGDKRAAQRLMLYYRLVRHSPGEAEHWRRLAEK